MEEQQHQPRHQWKAHQGAKGETRERDHRAQEMVQKAASEVLEEAAAEEAQEAQEADEQINHRRGAKEQNPGLERIGQLQEVVEKEGSFHLCQQAEDRLPLQLRAGA